ncbi:hypothetical protein DY262_18005 [Hydrogenophaga borbori]|uniref:Uncharacterized protein n=1 Tax=Hydrogenophaga borbori TaxID=2294117 RepID=A0A372EFN1_9BURK|nr:hypothetical protein [Hydrogenophaga borbori]RFP77251.1 hypothetical protein DY262_18005 [Hydrogenophaga borbori]
MHATLSQRLHLARILTPQQSQTEAAGLKQRPSLPPYMFHAALPDAVVQRFEDRTAYIARRFNIYPLPCGGCMAVATLQSDGLQLRTAVPLLDRTTHAWLEHLIAAGELTWLLEIEELRQTAQFVARCDIPDPAELRRVVAQASPLRRVELAGALEFQCAALLEPLAIESCLPAFQVTEAHVGLVVPDIAQMVADDSH